MFNATMMQYAKQEAALKKVKFSRGRITRIRKALIEVLCRAGLPVSSAHILQSLKKKGLNPHRTTVYRELLFLAGNDIVQKVVLDGENYFEISSSHHHHLICRKCRSIEEVVLGPHLEGQEHRIFQKRGFKVSHHSLEFYGLCKNCQDGR